jgi:hypothetical protein
MEKVDTISVTYETIYSANNSVFSPEYIKPDNNAGSDLLFSH